MDPPGDRCLWWLPSSPPTSRSPARHRDALSPDICQRCHRPLARSSCLASSDRGTSPPRTPPGCCFPRTTPMTRSSRTTRWRCSFAHRSCCRRRRQGTSSPSPQRSGCSHLACFLVLPVKDMFHSFLLWHKTCWLVDTNVVIHDQMLTGDDDTWLSLTWDDEWLMILGESWWIMNHDTWWIICDTWWSLTGDDKGGLCQLQNWKMSAIRKELIVEINIQMKSTNNIQMKSTKVVGNLW